MVRTSLAILLVSIAAQAQLTRTSESIEVNVIEVDVVVLDANGRPVTGLHPTDFDLRVGGHKRQITNFYEINRREDQARALKGEAPAPPTARRDYIVLFIDDLHLNQHEKKRSLDGLRTFVKQHIGPGTAAMLVSCDGSLHVLCRFTEKSEPLISAIDAFEQRPAHVSEFQRERHELLNYIDEQRAICQDPNQSRACVAEAIPQRIETLAQLEAHMVAQTTDSLSYMTSAISGLDGRRVLVYVSDGLSMQPGAEVYQYFKPEEFMADSHSAAALRILQQSQPMDALGHNLGESMTRLAKETALNGVQFFAINARGVQGFDDGIESQASKSRLDSSLIRSNLNSPLQLMADETGGRAIIDENDMELAFTKLDDHLASYYSLGFVSEGTDRDESVAVSVKRKGMSVRATKHVRQRTAREAIADRVRSSLYSRIEDNPLEARVTLVPLAEKSGLKATITIPTSKLSILPQDVGYGTSFSVFVAMMDEGLRETPVRMFVHRVSAAEVSESVQTLTLEVPPGSYTVSLAVADSYSSTVSYVQDDIRIGPAQ